MKKWAILDSENRPFLVFDSKEEANEIAKDMVGSKPEHIEIK